MSLHHRGLCDIESVTFCPLNRTLIFKLKSNKLYITIKRQAQQQNTKGDKHLRLKEPPKGITFQTPPSPDRKTVRDRQSVPVALLKKHTLPLVRCPCSGSLFHATSISGHNERLSLPTCFRMSQRLIFIPPLPSRMPKTN